MYIGLRAIAYVIADNSKVIKHGIKRVNIPFDNYYEFIAGQPVTKRINKRLKAQARRNLWRYKSRKHNLKKLLLAQFNAKPQHLTRTQNLELRVKALTQKLSPQELTNVFCQLQVKRGYKSMRGVSDNDGSDYLKQIQQHEDNLTQYPSIAAYLLTLPSSKNIIFTRQSYEAEFFKIAHAQQLSGQLTQSLYKVIYFQRPLKKPKVSKCQYERNRSVTHASNPLYQTFRIWRDVNNIKIYNLHNEEVEIDPALRVKWAHKCIEGANLTKAQCLKDLGLKSPSQYTWYSGKLIAGHPVHKAFGSLGLDVIAQDLWQDIYSATDNDRLATLLANKYQFSPSIINELLDLDFNKLGWSDFSTKAIHKLLPHLQYGLKLKEAILVVYGKVDFNNVALRNVVLEQHYFATQSLYAALASRYQITQVQFEVDPLLKQGNKGRKAKAQSRRKEDKFNKIHSNLSDYNRIKLMLWEESGGICPYQPDVIIDKAELFTEKYNLDHIIPKSKLFERSLSNQVLCPTNLNTQKGRLTGADFAKSLGILDQYLAAVEKFPPAKQAFLLMSETHIPTNYISQKQNTDYNTRCFATLFPKATNIPNKLINRFFSHWKANQYNEQDARYYLQKAWVMANLSQQTIDYFDAISIHSENSSSVSVYNLTPTLKPLNLSNVLVVLPKVKHSRKTKFGYNPRFALHQESVFGLRSTKHRNAKGEIVEQTFYKIRQPIAKLTPAMVTRIMDKAIREQIQNRLSQHPTHEEGILSLTETPSTHNGKPINRVSVRYNAAQVFPLHSTDGKGNTSKLAKFEKKVDFVFSEKSYCLHVYYNKQGKLVKDKLTLMQYIQALNNGQNLPKGFILKENDIIELNQQYYYMVGVSDVPNLRPVHTLAAKDDLPIRANLWPLIKKVIVNQIGDIIKTYGIKDC